MALFETVFPSIEAVPLMTYAHNVAYPVKAVTVQEAVTVNGSGDVAVFD